MDNNKKLGIALGALVLTLNVSCYDDLVSSYVTNSQPSAQIDSTDFGAEVEAMISSSFGLGFWAGTQWSVPSMTLSTIADEISSAWANWGMRDLSGEPRHPWRNSITYSRSEFTLDPWIRHYGGIQSLNRGLFYLGEGVQIGQAGVDTDRAIAFAHFVSGLSHGFVSLMYDQGYILTEPALQLEELPSLFPHQAVLAAAISQLDRAIAIAERAPFEITAGDDWIFGLDVDEEYLIRLANSYAARYLASSARNPADRANLDWAEILRRVDRGIVADFAPIGDDNGDVREWDAMKFYGQEHRTWSRADYRTIGPADESGGYNAWLETTPVYQRDLFVIRTSDKRITADINRPTISGTDFLYGGYGPWALHRAGYHYSSHTHNRYLSYLQSDANGPMPTMLVTEMDMLKAEGLLRIGGDLQLVADLINKTRVSRGGMNPAAGSDLAGSPEDSQSHLDAASLWSKLKHEKRIETYATAAGLAYFDDRGWGDLVSGTPIHFPVPALELDLLFEAHYTFGGVGGVGGAPKRGLTGFSPKNSHPLRN